jgi:CRISPR/Cas system-associated exonuclease Cas4 (RecB family)
MGIPRGEPYIWVTWLPKLLVGEAHCQWALWFRAHHRYEKASSTLNAALWCAQHAALVEKTAEALRNEGWMVSVEDQNKFARRGKRTNATIAGKPDVIAVKGDVVRVIECKTGAPKGSDCMQVLIYMLLLPYVRSECNGRTVYGEVRYADGLQVIEPSELTEGLQEHIWKVIRQAADSNPPPKVPSGRDCRFCDITATDCADKIELEPEYEGTALDMF